MLRKELGIDIGTTQITICGHDGDTVFREPNVAALDVDTAEVVEAGFAARKIAADAPDRVRLCWPVWDPLVRNIDILAAILRIFLRRIMGRAILRPQVMVSIPCDLTEAQTNALEDAVLSAGASSVHLLEAPLCAALGAGLDFSKPEGQMLVHIGASRTESAVIFLGDMVTHVTVPVGGNRFDSAIIKHMRERYQLDIGRRTAEQIKMRFGLFAGENAPKTLDIKGKCLKTGQPRIVTVPREDMPGALREPLAAVLDAVCLTVERTAPELCADIEKNGVVLTGGGILKGMDQFFADVIRLRTRIAAEPQLAAARGAVRALAKLK